MQVCFNREIYPYVCVRSNGAAVDDACYAFSATAVSFERNAFLTKIQIVPNLVGVNATAYDIYVYCNVYPANTYFNVEAPTGSWLSNLSSVTADPEGYRVPFEQVINNNTFIAGNVGINIHETSGYRLAVAGSAIAESMAVKLKVQWPDFVFLSGYNLSPLKAVENYIHKNQRLPEMPSQKEVAENGLNLGEIIRLQTKRLRNLRYTLSRRTNSYQIKESSWSNCQKIKHNRTCGWVH